MPISIKFNIFIIVQEGNILEKNIPAKHLVP